MEKIKINPDRKVTSYFESYKTGLIIYAISNISIILALLITTDIEFTFYAFIFLLIVTVFFYYNSKRKRNKGELVNIEFDLENKLVTFQIMNKKDIISVENIPLINLKIEEVADEWSDMPSYLLAFYNQNSHLITQGPDKFWSIKNLQEIFNTYRKLNIHETKIL